MTIANSLNKNTYTGNDVTTEFPYTFEIIDDTASAENTDIQVILTEISTGADTIIASNYTIDVVNNIVNYPISGSPLSDGYKITVNRNVPITQETALLSGGPYLAEVIEAAFDKGAIIDQQLQEQIKRSLKNSISVGDEVSLTLPAPVPGKIMRWDATGTQLENTPMEADYAAQAAASAAAALVSEVNAAVILANSVLKGQDSINVKYPPAPMVGCVIDGVTDDSAAFQAIHDSVVAGGVSKTLVIPSGVMKINSGITIDISYVSIDAKGTIIDATGVNSGYAILVTGSLNPPYYQAKNFLKGFELAGNSQAGTVIGLKLDTVSAGNGTSHICIEKTSIHDFGTGIYLGNHSYANNFMTVDVLRCGKCIDSPSGLSDYGERHTFIGCTFFNSTLAVNHANLDGSLNFTNCSFDYNAQLFNITGGRLFANNCHMESNLYTTYPIVLSGNGTAIVIQGGWLLWTGTVPNSLPAIVNNTSPATCVFRDVFMNSLLNNNNLFADGTGITKIENMQSYYITNNSVILAANASLLADGGFEGTFPSDSWFITGDTAAITNQIAGTNIALTQSTTEARTGTQSLKVAKSGAVGTVCRFALAVPIKKGSRIGMKCYYKKPGTGTGTVYFSTAYGTIKSGSIPSYLATTPIGTLAIPFTSTPGLSWTEIATGEPFSNAPVWATHYIIDINMDQFSADSIHFDDLLITEM